MTYSETDFSFAINSVSDFDSASESGLTLNLNLILLQDICIFFILYLHSSK